MSAFYNKMATTARNLINRFGQAVVLERITGQTIDPVTGKITQGEDNSKTTRGLLTNYDTNEIDGTLILATDKKLIIDSSVKPLITDRPKISGEYAGSIVHIKESNPAGVPLVYFLQMRK